MSESSVHAALVNNLAAWIQAQVSGDVRAVVLVDILDVPGATRPPLINGYCPDVYCESLGRAAFVGEAKTTVDLETRRSREQIAGFLRYLATKERGTLVIAVPWRTVPRAKTLFRYLQRATSTESVYLVFLEMLPG